MTEKARIKIAVLMTALLLGATVLATTLTHPHRVTVTAVRAAQTAPPAHWAPGANRPSNTEHESYD